MGWHRVQGLFYLVPCYRICFLVLWDHSSNDIDYWLLFGNRVAVYKAVYPTVGTFADVVAAIDQVGH